MLANHLADSSTTKPIAVVVPCQRLSDDSERSAAQLLAASGQTARCDDATSTDHQVQTSASVSRRPENVSDDRRQHTGSTQDTAAWLNDVQTSTCTVRPSRLVVQPHDDSELTTCSFYHGNINSDEAKRRLADKSVGTYLLRDSQSASFPLSLSVRTSGRSGVTSLRIARDGNNFRLDCDESHRAMMPKFDSVLRLVRHFTAECDGGEGGRCLLVGSSAASQNDEQPLTLRHPLQRPTAADQQWSYIISSTRM